MIADETARLIDQYASEGVIVDTNILLLHFVGQFDRDILVNGSFKRTQQFLAEEFDLLKGILARFRRIVTTPGILTEVNSLSNQLGRLRRRRFFRDFAERIETLDERYIESRVLARSDSFEALGLADTGILRVARDNLLVLTDDYRLANLLGAMRIDAINFNHIRSLGWRS